MNSVANLVSQLKDDDYRVRFRAADALLKMARGRASDVQPVIPELIASLLDSHSPVVDRAMWALGTLGEPALQALIVSARAGTELSRRMALLAIASCIENSEQRAAVLIDALASEEPEIRKTAAIAICNLAQHIGTTARHRPEALDRGHRRIQPLLRTTLEELAANEELNHPPFTERALVWIKEVAVSEA